MDEPDDFMCYDNWPGPDIEFRDILNALGGMSSYVNLNGNPNDPDPNNRSISFNGMPSVTMSTGDTYTYGVSNISFTTS